MNFTFFHLINKSIASTTRDPLMNFDFVNYYDLFKPDSSAKTENVIFKNSNPVNPNDQIPPGSFVLAITILYSILIVTSLISNPLLIYVLLVRRKRQIKLIDIFVSNLSLSDLFLTIFNIPLSLIIYFSDEWPFGSLLCQVATYSTSCSIYVNILTMTYISIDRYFAITSIRLSNPNAHRKKSILYDVRMRRKIYSALTFIWIIALSLSLPQFLFTKVSKKSKKSKLYGNLQVNESKSNSLFGLSDYDDTDNLLEEFDFHDELSEDPFKKCLLSYPINNMKIYMTFINFALQYLIPLLVILYFYGKIIYHLYLNLNVAEFMDPPIVDNSKKRYRTFAQQRKLGKKPSLSSYDLSEKSRCSSIPPISQTTSSVCSLTDSRTRKPTRMHIEGKLSIYS